jgi:UDP-N-acetylmuramoyl-tripeptide--D-alanyl-D-alanine ligase
VNLWVIAAQAAVVAVSALSAPRYIHMLQLSSYQANGYFRRLREGGLFTVFAKRRGKAKKPLKYTARAVRLLCAHILLTCCLSFAVWLPYALWLTAPAAALVACSPLPAAFANIVTLPLQSAVNARYIRSAKKILRSLPNLLVIGVTGSYGKTSVKHILAKLLSVRHNVFATPGSYNTALGVVRAIREGLRAEHEVFVCEMGARHIGDIRKITDIARPRFGVITSVAPQHLETFRTVENIADTKFELVRALGEGGRAFLCADYEHIRARAPASAVTFGLMAEYSPDYLASDIEADSGGTRFTVRARDGQTQQYRTSLLGRHQVGNILAAIAVAHTMGLPLAKLAGAVRGLQPVPHRLQLIAGGRLTIIDDAYNSNPAGAEAALDVLAMFPGVKVLVTPGMVELGEREYELNKAFGLHASRVCQYAALVGKRRTAPIAEGLQSLPGGRVAAFDTLGEAMTWVCALEGDKPLYVLLENDLPDNYV